MCEWTLIGHAGSSTVGTTRAMATALYHSVQLLHPTADKPIKAARHTQPLDQFECPSRYCPDRPRCHEVLSDAPSLERYIFKSALSSGFEGAISIYNDTRTGQNVAIKSFYVDRSPLRDTLPDAAVTIFGETRWPTELQFMLLHANQLHTERKEPTNNGLVNVKDYFIVDDGGSKQWQLVTKFYQYGTLRNAGPKIARLLDLAPNLTTSHLDDIFRSSFEGVLQTLTRIHAQGFCHDDIKPANIFISDDPNHWLLGDFGNVRETSHPYHDSKIWKRQNQWRDCRKNDIRRLIMVYLSFLRSFHHTDTFVFDGEFLKGTQGWARLYWEFCDVQDFAPASTTHITTGPSESTRGTTSPLYYYYYYAPPARFVLSSNQAAAKMQVDRRLHCSFRTWSGRIFD
ncbi:hypothetical protein D6C98_09724, partial [Aureobasidium pullulans]